MSKTRKRRTPFAKRGFSCSLLLPQQKQIHALSPKPFKRGISHPVLGVMGADIAAPYGYTPCSSSAPFRPPHPPRHKKPLPFRQRLFHAPSRPRGGLPGARGKPVGECSHVVRLYALIAPTCRDWLLSACREGGQVRYPRPTMRRRLLPPLRGPPPSTREARGSDAAIVHAPHKCHPERANKGESSGSPRAQDAPEAVCSHPTFARAKVTFTLKKVWCVHTAQTASCLLRDSSSRFVAFLRVTLVRRCIENGRDYSSVTSQARCHLPSQGKATVLPTAFNGRKESITSHRY